MKIEYKKVSIDSVKAHPKNARQGNINIICQSLKHNGQYRPIVVDKRTNYILAGNHTWKAAKSLKWKTIEVGYITTTDDKQALRILLADNRANDISAYDKPLLAKVLKELSKNATDLEGSLFDISDIEQLTKFDNVKNLTEFEKYDETIETEHKCPKCGYEWSGKQK